MNTFYSEAQRKAQNPDSLAHKKTEPQWTLARCVRYAMEHNLQISEAELNQRMARLVHQQQKNSRIPSLNADISAGESYGRSINPATNQFVTSGFLYNNIGLSSQTLLFGWFQKLYQQKQSLYELKASEALYDQLKDDVALNIATGFLRALMAREQVKVCESKLKQSNDQYIQTKKFAEAGRIPELNVAQMEAQVSGDSSVWVNAGTEDHLALLQLRALLNLDFETPFEIDLPSLQTLEGDLHDSIPDPARIYEYALRHQHKMNYHELKLESARQNLKLTRSVQYPQLFLSGSLGTNFSSVTKDITGQTYVGEVVLGAVKVGNTEYPITQPDYRFDTKTRPIFQQYSDNIRAGIGLTLNVPILNGLNARNNIQKAKVSLVSEQISYENDQLKLKQDIYTAYEQTVAATQKYQSALRAEASAQKALDFASRRYEIGMISTFEYNATLNTLFNASSSALSAKYDLIFKRKVLDYYMGNPIKL